MPNLFLSFTRIQTRRLPPLNHAQSFDPICPPFKAARSMSLLLLLRPRLHHHLLLLLLRLLLYLIRVRH